MASKLTNLSPFSVGGNTLPPPPLFQNIPMLHRILDEVLEDWLRAVEPLQRQIDCAENDSARQYATLSAIEDLRPSLLKCLFSYAFFFVAVDNAYEHFYNKLNRANHLLGLDLKHSKQPKKSSFVRKIGTIRDIAIAHFPSDKAEPIDAFAAMSWQPMALSYASGGRPDLEKLTFAPGRFHGTDSTGRRVESKDLEVSGVKTAHYSHCSPYLNDYDELCYRYLKALHAAMI